MKTFAVGIIFSLKTYVFVKYCISLPKISDPNTFEILIIKMNLK